jgi:hypothetical protein
MNRLTRAATAAIIVCLAFSSVASENTAKPAVRNSPKWLPAPFKLTPEEKASVTKVLEEWERQSAKFENYSCDVDCLTYNDAFREQRAEKGRFCIDKEGRFSFYLEGVNRGPRPPDKTEKSHWIYDGRQWTSASSDTKEVSRLMLTQKQQAAMRAPFVLRANAKELAAQYHIRITAHDKEKHQIFLQFYPRAAREAGFISRWLRGERSLFDWRDYHHVDLILSDETYVVQAMQVHDSEYSRTSYIAHNPVVNIADTADWFKFETPMGWAETKHPLDVQAEAKTPD